MKIEFKFVFLFSSLLQYDFTTNKKRKIKNIFVASKNSTKTRKIFLSVFSPNPLACTKARQFLGIESTNDFN